MAATQSNGTRLCREHCKISTTKKPSKSLYQKKRISQTFGEVARPSNETKHKKQKNQNANLNKISIAAAYKVREHFNSQ